MFTSKRTLILTALLGLGIFGAIFGPALVTGGSKSLYVDEDNKGKEDGSRDHPYRTISKALKNAKGGTNVFVAKGKYRENITIPSDVKVIGGKDNDDVVIEADNRSQPTVVMKDDTELNKITVVGGRHGIRVLDHDSAKIVRVVVKNSSRDGIHIENGTRERKQQVLIDRSVIKNNRMAGIFSEKRWVIILDSDITGNADGVDFTGGVKAWFEDNRINDNQGSGIKAVLDEASIWSKNNSIRRNGREGIEINAYGAAGQIGFKKAAVIDNGRYGIARVARTPDGFKALGGVILENNRLEGNARGALSPLLRGY